MEAKEEISDTDSGIILHSGPDSPTTVMKDVSTHTRAVKLKRQSLEDRLELCILELKKLCIREAELTGHLSSDYPLQPGEKPPQIRRRIGAAFKLDELSIFHRGGEDSELRSVESKLALQQQIHVAARRLCQEEHLSKAVRKSRLQQCRREEQKLKELQEAIFHLQLQHGRSSPRPGMIQKLQGTSDDSSLSDSALLDEEELTSQSSQVSSEPPPLPDSLPVPPGTSHRPLTPPIPSPLLQLPDPSPRQALTLPLEVLDPCCSPTVECDPAPIQNSPWTESSLDQPYQKKKSSSSRSSKSSPAVTPTLPPLEACLEEAGLTLQIPSHASLRHLQSSSAPSTPELHLRRGYSLRVPNSEPHYDVDRDRGRSRGPRRRLTEVSLASPSPEYSQIRLAIGNQVYLDSSEDSNSEHSSAPSYASSPCHEHSFELQQPCQSHYRNHYSSPPNHYVPQPYVHLSHYQPPSPQPSPNFYRGYLDDGRCHDVDMSRMYIRHQPSPPYANGHYEHWYEETPQFCRPIPPHVKLSRAPSLREYPHHPSRGLPRQVVSEELKSWHQRSQLRPPRPHSLDRHRQGAVRVRNLPGHEPPLPHHHSFQEQQVPQRRIIQRTADGTPIKWYEEEDAEIVSQV